MYLQMVLPESLTRENNKMYEEVNIPPSDAAPTHVGEHKVTVAQMDEVTRLCRALQMFVDNL